LRAAAGAARKCPVSQSTCRSSADPADHGGELLAQSFQRGPHGGVDVRAVSAQGPVRRPLERTRRNGDLASAEESGAPSQSVSEDTNFLDGAPWILLRTGQHRDE
jgi:hypothetical protein